jgi:hypothetical protein
MTDQELKDLVASLAIDTKEIKEAQRKTDEQLKRTDEKLERVGIRVGNISNNQGDVAEEYFFNSLQKDLRLGSIKFDIIDKNTLRRVGNLQDEFDIILINGESVALIEVKYKVHPNDVEKLEKKIKNFRKLFPIYKDFKLYAGLAGFVIPQDVFKTMYEKGYFILQRKGEVLESYTDNLIAA